MRFPGTLVGGDTLEGFARAGHLLIELREQGLGEGHGWSLGVWRPGIYDVVDAVRGRGSPSRINHRATHAERIDHSGHREQDTEPSMNQLTMRSIPSSRRATWRLISRPAR